MLTYPYVSIEFCTACKWNLRASWYAQELLSTFSTGLGTVSLIPTTGGIFVVRLQASAESEDLVLWDRKVNGGFPDSKDLKRLVRDVLFPARDLGHIDRHVRDHTTDKAPDALSDVSKQAEECEECKQLEV